MAVRILLGEILRERGLTSRSVADQTGLRKQTVRAIVTGRVTRFNLSTIEYLMRALDLSSVAELLQFVPGHPLDEPPPPRLRRRRPSRRKPVPRPCGHVTPSRTCYDCLYPPDPVKPDRAPRSHRTGGEED